MRLWPHMHKVYTIILWIEIDLYLLSCHPFLQMFRDHIGDQELQVTEDDRIWVKGWFPVLFELSRVINRCKLDVRTRSVPQNNYCNFSSFVMYMYLVFPFFKYMAFATLILKYQTGIFNVRSCQRLKEPGSTSTCANFWFPFNNMFYFITLTLFFLFVELNIIIVLVLWYTLRLDFTSSCILNHVFKCIFVLSVSLYYFCICFCISYIVYCYIVVNKLKLKLKHHGWN